MSNKPDSATMANIEQYDGEQRYQYLLNSVATQGQIWILTDKDGCVMLNTEDEDCVPIWPDEAFARQWAVGEWADCEPQAIDLTKWFNDWTQGLIDDDLVLVAFPNQNNEGLVVFADEFDFELKKQLKKAGA